MTVTFMLSYIVLWLLALLLAAATFALARQIGVLHVRLPAGGARLSNAGPEIGEAVPEFRATDMFGRGLILGGLKPKNTLFVFVSPGCSSCADLAPAIKSASKSEERVWDIILISIQGDTETNRNFVALNELDGAKYVISPEVAGSQRVSATPYGVALDRQGVVRSKGIINTFEHLESLLNAIELGHASVEQYLRRKSVGISS